MPEIDQDFVKVVRFHFGTWGIRQRGVISEGDRGPLVVRQKTDI